MFTKALVALIVSSAATAQQQNHPSPLTLGVYMVEKCGSGNASAPIHPIQGAGDYCLDRNPLITQLDITSASIDPYTDLRSIKLALTRSAGQRFERATGKNIGRSIGIVLNGKFRFIAMITGVTTYVWITGLNSQDEQAVLGAFAIGNIGKGTPPPLAAPRPD